MGTRACYCTGEDYHSSIGLCLARRDTVAIIEDRTWSKPMACATRRAIDDSDLEGMLSAGGTPVDIVPQLLEAALTRGALDNVTAVRVRLHGE